MGGVLGHRAGQFRGREKKGSTVAERFPGIALPVRRPHPEIKLGLAERRAARFSYVYTFDLGP